MNNETIKPMNTMITRANGLFITSTPAESVANRQFCAYQLRSGGSVAQVLPFFTSFASWQAEF
jgi:hypothetical protein